MKKLILFLAITLLFACAKEGGSVDPLVENEKNSVSIKYEAECDMTEFYDLEILCVHTTPEATAAITEGVFKSPFVVEGKALFYDGRAVANIVANAIDRETGKVFITRGKKSPIVKVKITIDNKVVYEKIKTFEASVGTTKEEQKGYKKN